MAVYTEVSDEDLVSFVAEYDIGDIQSCKGIAEGVENSNYLLQTDRGNFILTLYEKRVQPEDLPFFLGLMEHLAERNFPCPTPIHAPDGVALRELNGKPAAMISFLSGMWPKRINSDHCREVGVAAAKMHLAADGFGLSRKNGLDRKAWQQLFDQTKDRADEIDTGLASKIESELTYLDENWPADLPGGIIHADLFPDNVFFHGNDLSGIIDFYFACNGSFAYEIAICLNAWCFEDDGSFNITKAHNLVKGYNSARMLEEAEITALPLLARGSALRFLLTRLYDLLNHPPGALVNPKDPLEYLQKLRFHQQADDQSAYGLAGEM
ncbi:MAG: homoserine kinase [Rhodospirillaceae bacterium]|nr:homoserine kinase [Rhodospirillaceae bacterium]|tara:strand:- start:2168 stop:3139 length:972 start_codon:yes stop_codon:yes gene_type:complete